MHEHLVPKPLREELHNRCSECQREDTRTDNLDDNANSSDDERIQLATHQPSLPEATQGIYISFGIANN